MLKRKILTVILALSLVFSFFPAAAFAADEKTYDDVNYYFYLKIGEPLAIVDSEWVPIDNDNENVVPVIRNNRTLVPLRFIAENMGASVTWDQATKTATIKKTALPQKGYYPAQPEKTIKITIDAPKMLVNEAGTALDQPACVEQNRTLVPIRAIAEAFNLYVEYDSATKGIYIDSYKIFPDKLTSKDFGKEYPYSISLPEGISQNQISFAEEEVEGYMTSLLEVAFDSAGSDPSPILNVFIMDTTGVPMSIEKLRALNAIMDEEKLMNSGFYEEAKSKSTEIEVAGNRALTRTDFKITGKDGLEYSSRVYNYMIYEKDHTVTVKIDMATEDGAKNEDVILKILKSFKEN